MSNFLKWWFIVGSSLVVIFATSYIGFAKILWEADVTKISFIILTIFIYQSVRTGITIYFNNKEKFSLQKNENRFVSTALQSLGMLGTVIGLVYMLNQMSTIEIDGLSSAKEVLKIMMTGMATAFYTTLMGLVCSLVLDIQSRIIK